MISFVKDIRTILNPVRWAITAGHNTVFHWGLVIWMRIAIYSTVYSIESLKSGFFCSSL
jgi:hypothetical protein